MIEIIAELLFQMKSVIILKKKSEKEETMKIIKLKSSEV